MTHANAQTPFTPKRGRMTMHGEAERLPALRPGFCDYCGKPLSKQAKARHARFCQAKCREHWWIMARNRGAQLYQMLRIWRRDRGRSGTRGARMLGRITSLIDAWVRFDKEDAE
ncbi:hypothetical protein [uncultured Tateyamaria sp.]|uniref:hypothetical protein n=1 Tax=Tateyamaria sp. 1078 TaxID=3417464 RepID=UPI002624D073|nr:hypothetical protein [uncultured Tateyamaria sp.]